MRRCLLAVLCIVALGLVFTPCAMSKEKPIKIGLNAPITGDIPKVGEGSKFAAKPLAGWKSAGKNIQSNW